MSESWEGRTVVITGGAGGMGRAFARRFLAAGARVFLCDWDREALDAASAELGRLSLLETLVCDVTVVRQIGAAIDAIIAQGGRLDLLVNAAGIWTEGPSEAATEDEWDRVIDVNLKGTFFACRHALPHLERVGGAIINISSDAGTMGTPGAAIYSASKAGVNLVTKVLALEFAERGVRVNAVAPTDVATPMIEFQAHTFGKGDPEGYKTALLARYPQRRRARFVRAEEVAALVFFLASAEAEPITGACLALDFGTTAGML
jgi:NAD(P)-dependent dehydrogenase (short-subunit alcohol dehydrogenase family)